MCFNLAATVARLIDQGQRNDSRRTGEVMTVMRRVRKLYWNKQSPQPGMGKSTLRACEPLSYEQNH